MTASADLAGDRRWLSACNAVGVRPWLNGRPTIENFRRIEIGDRFRLSSRPVPSHLVAGPEAVLSIGSDVAIGHGAAVAAFERIEIGDGTRIGPFVIVMDTNFHGASGDQSVQHDCRPVTIGRGCRIGSRVTITRGASIGDGAEILAGSVVSSAIPAGVRAGGARARVLGRVDEPPSRWDHVAPLLPQIASTVVGRGVSDAASSPLVGEWTDEDVARFAHEIRRRLGASIDLARFRAAATWTEAAAAIDGGATAVRAR